MRSRATLLALIAALAIAAGAGLSVQGLGGEAADRHRVSVSLLSLEATLQELHALGLETVTDRSVSPGEIGRFIAGRARAQERLDEIEAAAPDLTRPREDFERLQVAGAEVVDLRLRGKVRAARAVAETRARPIFRELQDELQDESRRRADAAGSAERLARWGGGAILAVALALIAALFWVIDRARLRSVRRHAEGEALRRSVLAALEEGVVVLDPAGRVVSCNAAGARILGIAPADIVGRRPPVQPTFRDDGTPVHEGDGPALEALATRSAARDVVLQVERPDGTRIWISTNHNPLEAGGLVCSFLDITERRRGEEQITHLAYHDPLTGLPNRAQLEARLDHVLTGARRESETAALLCVDLDGFKGVNDALGHTAGDEVLRQVAARLRSGVRSDDLLTRHGGDEFVVLLSRLGPEPAAVADTVARELASRLESPLTVEGVEVTIGASVGVGLFPTDGEDPSALLQAADAAMYRAKRSRGIVAFASSALEDFVGREREELDEALAPRERDALEELA